MPEKHFFGLWIPRCGRPCGDHRGNRTKTNGDAHGVLEGNAGQRIRGLHAAGLRSVRDQRVQLRRGCAFDRTDLSREGDRFVHARKRRIVQPASMRSAIRLGAAERQAALGDRTVVAPLVAMVMHAGDEPRVLRDLHESAVQ